MSDDVLVVPKSKEEVIKYLNLVLESHGKYESWMKFDDFEMKGHIKVPRYKSPEDGQTNLSRAEYEDVYRAVAAQVLDI